MKRYILVALFAVLAASFFARADAFRLPKEVVHVTDRSQLFWCQNEDIQNGSCEVIASTKDGLYALVKIMGGVACPDPTYGVINLVTGNATDIAYNDNQECSGEVVANFTYDPADGTRTVILYDPTIRKNVGVTKINF